MAKLLLSTKVAPLYAQVELYDPLQENVAQFKTGKEAVVASENSIIVATRRDSEGKIDIKVWNGAPEKNIDGYSLIYEGEVAIKDNKLMIGSFVGNDIHEVPVNRDKVHVKVLTSPLGSPSNVDSVLIFLS